MKIEIEIRQILSRNMDSNKKIEEISKFMTWEKQKLIYALNKFGTTSSENRSKIINFFWNKKRLKKNEP